MQIILPLSLLCIIMILRVRRNFFEITTFPNSVLLRSLTTMIGLASLFQGS